MSHTSSHNPNGNSPDEAPLSAGGFAPLNATGNHSSTPSDEVLSAASFQPLNPASKPVKSIPWPWLAAGAAGLVASFCLLFLLSARSLEVVVNAEGSATVDIDGLAVPMGQRYLIRPGNYPITVVVPGYAPLHDTITVTDADSQQYKANPAILPGKLSITTTPTNAEISLDGTPLGNTPMSSQHVEAGDYTLTLAVPRYQPVSTALTVTGRGVEQQLSFDLAPDWADITVTAVPTDAEVLIDGEPLGTAGEPIEVLSGEHQLTLRAPGYAETTVALTVSASVPQALGPIELIPANGLLSLASSPTGANVTVDGQFAGRTPLSIELAPGKEHLLQLSKAGYRRSSLRVSLEKGAASERTVTLAPQLGEVDFRLQPPSAELVINGKPMGSGSRSIALPSVEQRVEVRLEGYAAQRARVTPREGLKQVVEIALLTESEARKAALTAEVTSALGQTLVLIDPLSEPMNEFQMGASRREPGRRSNEVEHTVRLERAFYIATTETTNAQFRQFLASHDSGQIEGNSLNREHQPAVKVSWQQAARFCNWLSAKEGLPLFYRESQGIINGFNASSSGYRLPTEAEWSFVARVQGEGYRKFAWGEDFPPARPVVNVADNTSALVTGRILNGYADGHIVAAPVGSFPANHRGLFDLGGNVAEWVNDVYTIPSANADVATDPAGALSGDNYTVRGGSWALSRLSELRLTYRDYGAAGRDDLGFRIARYAE